MKLYQLGYIFTAGALLHCLQELTHFVSLWNLLCAWEEKIASEHAVKLSKLLCDIGCVTGLSPMGTVEHLLDTVCYNSSSLADVDKCLQMLCSPLCCAGIQHSPNVASLLDSQLTSVSEYHSLSSIRGRLASTQIYFFYISVSWQHVSSLGCIWGKWSSEPVFSCQGDEPWRGEWKQSALCTVQQLSDSVHSEVLLMEEAVSLSSLVCWNPVRHKCSPFSLQTILTWDGARLTQNRYMTCTWVYFFIYLVKDIVAGQPHGSLLL